MSEKPSSFKVYSLLHYACSCGEEEIFNFVLEQCKKLPEVLYNVDNSTNESPLHFAVSSNSVLIATILIEKIREIELNQENEKLINFSNYDDDSMRGGAPDKEGDGDDLGQFNAYNDKADKNIYEGCLDAVPNKIGHTPFMVAVMEGYIEMATLLLQD